MRNELSREMVVINEIIPEMDVLQVQKLYHSYNAFTVQVRLSKPSPENFMLQLTVIAFSSLKHIP